MIKFALILVLCTVAVSAQIGFGKCPEVVVETNFKMKEFLGTWYGNGRYFVTSEYGTKCNHIDISERGNDTWKMLRNEQEISTEISYAIDSTARYTDKDEIGKFTVTYYTLPVHLKVEYYILATDYTSYAVPYACRQFGNLHAKSARIITRERLPSEETIEIALKVFDDNHMDRSRIMKVDHTDCKK